MVIGFVVWTLVASLVTAALYMWDKRAAVKDHRRLPEKTLLGWALLGGWPGGLITGRSIRHKTQKTSYRIQFFVCAIIHVAASAWLFYKL